MTDIMKMLTPSDAKLTGRRLLRTSRGRRPAGSSSASPVAGAPAACRATAASRREFGTSKTDRSEVAVFDAQALPGTGMPGTDVVEEAFAGKSAI